MLRLQFFKPCRFLFVSPHLAIGFPLKLAGTVHLRKESFLVWRWRHIFSVILPAPDNPWGTIFTPDDFTVNAFSNLALYGFFCIMG